MLLRILLLALWLIATGLLPLTKVSIAQSGTALNVLAVVAGAESLSGMRIDTPPKVLPLL